MPAALNLALGRNAAIGCCVLMSGRAALVASNAVTRPHSQAWTAHRSRSQDPAESPPQAGLDSTTTTLLYDRGHCHGQGLYSGMSFRIPYCCCATVPVEDWMTYQV